MMIKFRRKLCFRIVFFLFFFCGSLLIIFNWHSIGNTQNLQHEPLPLSLNKELGYRNTTVLEIDESSPKKVKLNNFQVI